MRRAREAETKVYVLGVGGGDEEKPRAVTRRTAARDGVPRPPHPAPPRQAFPTSQRPAANLRRLQGGRRAAGGEALEQGGGRARAAGAARSGGHPRPPITINPISGWKSEAVAVAAAGGQLEPGRRRPSPRAGRGAAGDVTTVPSDGAFQQREALLQPLPRWRLGTTRRAGLSRRGRLNHQARSAPPISGRAENRICGFWQHISCFSRYRKMDTTMLNLRNLFEQLVRRVEILSEGNELQFIQLAKDFEDFRKKWQRTDHELGKYKDLLMKAETERSALDVKLKHARNQVDVEIKRRQRAEADCEKLERQIQLIREMLMCDTSVSIQLSEEQKSALAFLNRGQPSIGNAGNKRLSTIDESGSILSDISFDKTDESLDWDSSLVKAFKLKKREKRRSSSRQFIDGPPGPIKKTRSIGSTADQGNESIVAKTTVTVPNDGGPIEATSTIETVPCWTRSRGKTGTLQPWNSDSTLSSRRQEPHSETDGPSTPQGNGGTRLHDFVSKTVIKPESCVPCGKRIKFGKLSLKCRDCRVVSHPECRDRCPLPCIPTLIGTPVKIGEGMLADYVSQTPPMIPSIIVHCVNEIEQRGLSETGLYRVSGCDRTVKELKEKFFRVKTVPLLSKVDDIHAVCSLLKDFLRNLKEPLLTFRLNRTFMEAAEITDEDNSMAAMYQAVGELPQANRDTLAFLMIHLQRVAQSPNTKMDVANLAKVFGPTIVAHAVPNPDPVTMLQDIKRQPKVVERLLSLPLEYWSQFMMVEQENIDPTHVIENANAFSTPQTPDIKVSLLGPVTTPEHQLLKTPSSSSLSQRVRSTLTRNTPRFGSKSKSATNLGRQGNFFASPMLK